VSIEPEGEADTVCIAVDAPDSLYVCEHAIVTHNTTVSLALVEHLAAWPLLVVAPLAAFSTWLRQLEELGRSALLCTGRVDDDLARMGEFDSVVVSYDRLHRFGEALEHQGFAAIVADEVQRIRTPGSRRSRALRTLAGAVPIRIGLSGTPVTNRAEDVLPIGAFLIPGEWKPRLTQRDLAELYPGEDPVESLAEHLGTMMVRRRMDDTGVTLPGRTVRRVPVTLSPEQRRALRDLEEEARAAALDGDLSSRMHIFARLASSARSSTCLPPPACRARTRRSPRPSTWPSSTPKPGASRSSSSPTAGRSRKSVRRCGPPGSAGRASGGRRRRSSASPTRTGSTPTTASGCSSAPSRRAPRA